VRSFRRGDIGAAVTEIRSILVTLQLLASADPAPDFASSEFDEQVEKAVRLFQQQRGLSVDGQVGDETWRALDAARWVLGARTLDFTVTNPLHGDDVRQLQ
jgi:N-acetylmuramoyl-L-alanine amidase